jgi:hypothetical protein
MGKVDAKRDPSYRESHTLCAIPEEMFFFASLGGFEMSGFERKRP